MRGPTDGAPRDEVALEVLRQPLQRLASRVRRCPVLLQPLLLQVVGTLPHQDPPKLLEDGDVAVLVDSCRVFLLVLEDKWADDALAA